MGKTERQGKRGSWGNFILIAVGILILAVAAVGVIVVPRYGRVFAEYRKYSAELRESKKELADAQKKNTELLAARDELQALDAEVQSLQAETFSYAAELASQACADLGEGGLAMKVGLVGKLCVFSMTAPLLIDMLEMILELVP